MTVDRHTIGVPETEQSSIELICHRCGCALTAGEGSFYIVRIEAFADPSPPVIDESEPTSQPGDLEALLEELERFSGQELMDQVYRRMTISLCAACYARWIDNPAGA